MTDRSPTYFRSPSSDIPDAWCGSLVPYPSEQSIGDVFDETAAKYADRVAVRHCDEVLTYSGLRDRSDAFSCALVRAGVTPGELVGIASVRRIEMAVALLGILKAGAAYVPLDSSYPQERLQFQRQTR